MPIRAIQLHPAQRDIYFDQLVHPENPQYVTGAYLVLRGELHTSYFRQALEVVLSSHDVFRLRFDLQVAESMGYIVDHYTSIPLQEQDYSQQDDAEACALEWMQQQCNIPFRIDVHTPLFEHYLIKIAPAKHLYFFKVHHLLMDLYAYRLWLLAVARQYRQLLSGDTSIPSGQLSYLEDIEKSIAYHASDVYQRQVSYWRHQLTHKPDRIYAHKRAYTATADKVSNIYHYALSDGEREILEKVTAATGQIGLQKLTVAALLIYYARITGHPALLFGIARHKRRTTDQHSIIGTYAGIVPFKGHYRPAITLSELLADIDRTQQEDLKHQYAALSDLSGLLRHTATDTSLFEIVVNHAMLNFDLDMGAAVTSTFHQVWNEFEQRPLRVYWQEYGRRQPLQLSLMYRLDAMTPEDAALLPGRLFHILAQFIDGLKQPLAAISILPPAEAAQLSAHSQALLPPAAATITSLFEAQARRVPARIALSAGQQQLSYQALSEQVDIVAARLINHGVQPDTWVPVCLTPTPEMIIALLAILKTGAAYVPIDPAYPAERIRFMMEDTAAPVVITAGDTHQTIATLLGDDPQTTLLNIQELLQSGEAVVEDITFPVVRSEQAAYVIYTSGSTGQPKGVIIEHRNVVSLFHATEASFHFDENDVWTFFHSFCFDFSVWEMYGALLYGGRLVIVPKAIARDTPAFAQLLLDEQVTVLNQTPAAFYILQDTLADISQAAAFPPLAVRYVIFGGEALNPAKLKPWKTAYPDCRLINMYGITETTVHVTFQEILQQHLSASTSVIGQPISSLAAYILDAQGMLLPTGVPGELYIAGAGLARGYLNRPTLTQERFITPLHTALPHQRLYKTGDLARWLPDGTLEYLGRIDNQVKVRGYRIELGEIENALLQSGGVKQGVVIVRDGQLIAYIVPHEQYNKDALSSALKSRLPDYMIPASFVLLDKIPLTANGKTDKDALPAAYTAAEKVLPRTPTEQQLAIIWQEVLGKTAIGVTDNFFELGGDSINLIRVISQISKTLQRTVRVADIYQAVTIAALATLIDALPVLQGNSELIRQITASLSDKSAGYLAALGDTENIADVFPMSDIQVGMLVASLKDPGAGIYHDQFSYQLPITLDVPLFETALSQIVHRHGILRTGFQLDLQGASVQIVHHTVPVNIPVIAIPAQEDPASLLLTFLQEERNKPFLINQAPLWRAALLKGADHYLFVLQFHHAIADGWSVASFNTELNNRYLQLRSGSLSHPLPALKSTYKDFVIQDIAEKQHEAARDFWSKEMAVYKRIDIFSDERQLFRFKRKFDPALLEGLKEKAKSENLSLKTLFLGATVYTLGLLNFEREGTIGLVTNNRPLVEDGEQLLGCFLNTIPFKCTTPGSSLTWKQFFLQVEEKQQELQPYNRLSLSEITKLTNNVRLGENPFFDILFNFVNFHVYDQLASGLFAGGTADENSILFSNHAFTNTFLDWSISITENELTLLVSQTRPFKCGKTMEDICLYFQQVLEQLLHHYEESIDRNSILQPDDLPVFVTTDNQQTLPGHGSLISLFEAQASRVPTRIALSAGEQQLSYQALSEQVNIVAARLINQGVQPDTWVPVCLTPTPEMIIALLAILKTGAAYVPIDPAYPAERIRFMMEDTAAPVVITAGDTHQTIATLLGDDPQTTLLNIQELLQSGEAAGEDITFPVVRSEQAAYVIYTSGSTGQPKGVIIEHRNVISLFHATEASFHFGENDVWTFFHSFCFDFSVWEMYGALLYGGRLVIVPKAIARDTPAFAQLLLDEQVTVLNQTPAAFYILQDTLADISQAAAFPPLAVRYVIFGGEALNPAKLKPWKTAYPDCRLINMYGITETTVHVTFQEILQQHLAASTSVIGQPISSLAAYILDTQGMLLPTGVPGELYIAGAGLARGYLNRPALTQERFITPLHTALPHQRLYKTGDLARWLPDGTLEYLGRIDNQVKVRGYRIELGEIENALLQSGGVKQGVVIVRDGQLIAYIVPHEQYNKDALSSALKSRLPDYMIPASFVLLDKIPLTANGKTDKDALPAPYTATEKVLPRTPTEQQLAIIWQEVLGKTAVGVTDNFFELGGDSINLIRVISQVGKTLQRVIRVADIYQAVTIAALAALIDALPVLHGNSELIRQITATLSDKSAGYFAALGDTENIADVFPMSDIQLGMVLASLRHPDEGMYHDQFSYRLTDSLDVALFERALSLIVHKHGILRTSFQLDLQGESVQIVHGTVPVLVPVIHLRQDIEVKASLLTFLADQRKRPFVIHEAPLWRVHLLKAKDHYIFVLEFHHAIADGWSIASFNTELSTVYQQLQNGDVPAVLPVLSSTYKDFVIQDMAERRNEAARTFWARELEGYKRSDLFTDEKLHHRFKRKVDQALFDVLKEQAQAEGIALKTLFLGATIYTLGLLNFEQESTLGVVTNNRPLVEDGEQLLGCFLNTIPLRCSTPSAALTWKQFLDQLALKLEGLQPYDRLSLSAISNLVHHPSASENPFFDILFNFINFHVYDQLAGGIFEYAVMHEKSIAVNGYENTNTYLDWTINITGDELHVIFSQSRQLACGKPMEAVFMYFLRTLEALAYHYHAPIDRAQLLSAEEWAHYTPALSPYISGSEDTTSIVSLFEAQVRTRPDAIAIIDGDREVSYAVLNAHANRLGHYLKMRGVEKDVPVPICIDRSLELLIGILGILKAGGAYLPLSPAYSRDNVLQILNGISCPVAVSVQPHPLLPSSLPVVYLDVSAGELATYPDSNLSDAGLCHSLPDDIACMMFTSGSTGRPKGVMITHQNVSSLQQGSVHLALTPSDTLLSTGAITFDATLFEYWGTLLNGGRLVLCSQEQLLDSTLLKAIISAHGVTRMWFTSSWLNQLVDTDIGVFEKLVTVITGGDKLSAHHIAKLQAAYPSLLLINGYGPTENTTFSLLHPIEKGFHGEIPIGRPLQYRTAYVLDRQRQPLPAGVPGELYVGGAGLSKGYLQSPELTAARFVPDPFRVGAKLYNTGDLASYQGDGTLHFIGRTDDQVKIRGFRVEPGETEQVLLNSGMAAQAVVIASSAPGGSKQLIAYLVPREHYDAEALRQYLGSYLPDYMQPAVLYTLAAMPLTPSGKINKQALPSVALTHQTVAYTAPRSTTEQQLAKLWQELLGIPQIGIADDFFSLGGHSLLVIRVHAQLKKCFHKSVPIGKLYQHRVLADLAAYLDATPVLPATVDVIALTAFDRQAMDRIPLSFGQEELWLMDEADGTVHYHIPKVYQLSGPLHYAALQSAFQTIVNRHEALRAVIRQQDADNSLYQHFLPAHRWQAAIIDAAELSAAVIPTAPLAVDPSSALHNYLRSLLDVPFDLTQDHMLRVQVIPVQQDIHLLTINLHHIAADGWSLAIILQEFVDLYNAYVGGRSPELPLPVLQFADFAMWQRQQVAAGTMAAKLGYWQQQLAGFVPWQLPADRERAATVSYRGHTISFHIALEQLEALQQLSHQQGCTLFMTLLTGFKIVLSRYAGQQDICIATVLAGRMFPELESLVGFFSNNFLLLRSRLQPDMTFAELLQAVRQTTIAGFEHQDVPVELIASSFRETYNYVTAPLYQAIFMLQNMPAPPALTLEGLVAEEVLLSRATSQFDLNVGARVTTAGLLLSVEYNTDLFDEATIRGIFSAYLQLLKSVTTWPEQPILHTVPAMS